MKRTSHRSGPNVLTTRVCSCFIHFVIPVDLK
jgi:hypothetical protein